MGFGIGLLMNAKKRFYVFRTTHKSMVNARSIDLHLIAGPMIEAEAIARAARAVHDETRRIRAQDDFSFRNYGITEMIEE